MEFGKVTPEEFDRVDFSLSADRPETTRILLAPREKIKPQVFVGCAKWGRKDWVGKIYPKGTKEADFLKLYGQNFNSIELNASFYRMPSFAQAAEWKDKVQPGFLFCPKFSDKISHIKRLKDAQEVTERFLNGIAGFGNTLGPALLMPHPAMSAKHIEVIESYLESLPKEIRVFVELRHVEWYSNPDAFSRITNIFEKLNTGFVMIDTAGRRDAIHMRLTTPEAFIRFQGYALHPTDYSRVDAWVQRIKQWIEQGIQKVFFFMHQEDERNSPELARYAIQQLNKHCGLSIPEPKFVDGTEEVDPQEKKSSTRKTTRTTK
jgi:uncharacterized protein YecE (DUF72 family)